MDKHIKAINSRSSDSMYWVVEIRKALSRIMDNSLVFEERSYLKDIYMTSFNELNVLTPKISVTSYSHEEGSSFLDLNLRSDIMRCSTSEYW